jgi:hypothetical protein
MPITYPSTYSLVEALRAEGYELPAECTSVRLVMPADGVFQLELTVNVTEETLMMVGRALARVAGEHR